LVDQLVVSLLYCSFVIFFFSSRRRHTRSKRDWSSDVCSSDLDTLLEDNHKLRDHLKKLGYPLEYKEWEGIHDWYFWNTSLKMMRSEERRVGKECRSRWWGYD